MVILKNIFYPQCALDELFGSGCLSAFPGQGHSTLGIAACPGEKPAPLGCVSLIEELG